MADLTIPAPTQHDLDGGSVLTATVCKVDNGDFVAIVIDRRDAANLTVPLLNTRLDNHDDQEAIHKLVELIEAALET